jgi:hypothetical protein
LSTALVACFLSLSKIPMSRSVVTARESHRQRH